MLDYSKLSHEEYKVVGYIFKEIGSYRLKYRGPQDFLLSYVHQALYNNYTLITTSQGVEIRSKENPSKPIMIDEVELSFQEAVKATLNDLIDTGYEKRQANELQRKVELEKRKKENQAYENSLEYHRAKSVAQKNQKVIDKIEYEL